MMEKANGSPERNNSTNDDTPLIVPSEYLNQVVADAAQREQERVSLVVEEAKEKINNVMKQSRVGIESVTSLHTTEMRNFVTSMSRFGFLPVTQDLQRFDQERSEILQQQFDSARSVL